MSKQHRSASLSVKIGVLLFLLIFLPSTVFTIYSTVQLRNTLLEQNLSAARKAFDETADAISTRMQRASKVIDQLIYDPLVYTMASTDPADYPYIEILEDSRALGNSFDHLLRLSEVDSVRMYVRNEKLFSEGNPYLMSMSDLEETPYYEALDNAHRSLWFSPRDGLPPAESAFSCAHMIYSPSNLMMPLAVLRVDLSYGRLEEAISESSTTEHGIVMLLQENTPILSYSMSDIPDIDLPGIEPAADRWTSVMLGGEEYYVSVRDIVDSGWRLATLIPHEDIYGVINRLQTEHILITLIVCVLAFLLALKISHRLFHGIWDLSHAMEGVEHSGQLDTQLDDTGGDEIGQLISHFNHMMTRLDTLTDEKVAYGIEKKSLELKALQAQINPHFLYNTLDTINCLALQSDVPDISAVVSDLADFYKISLSRGKEYIPIQDEIRHAQAYLRILDHRFEGQISTEWDIDPEVLPHTILKTILQPIIENAAIHGIFEREDSSGTIRMRVWPENGDILFTIHDDGVGMPSEVIEANFAASMAEPVSGEKGYGIRNVNSRLILAYGPQYGLSCESEIGVGTTVTVRIPASPIP